MKPLSGAPTASQRPHRARRGKSYAKLRHRSGAAGRAMSHGSARTLWPSPDSQPKQVRAPAKAAVQMDRRKRIFQRRPAGNMGGFHRIRVPVSSALPPCQKSRRQPGAETDETWKTHSDAISRRDDIHPDFHGGTTDACRQAAPRATHSVGRQSSPSRGLPARRCSSQAEGRKHGI